MPDFKYPEIYFDYAFLTREKEIGLGLNSYILLNRRIIEKSQNLILRMRPRNVFLSSSGAIYGRSGKTNEVDSYGRLKIEQEVAITSAAKIVDANLITCRIFNVSGQYMGKPETFALTNFIDSAKSKEEITLYSDTLVFRRYCSDSDLIELILEMAKHELTDTFDSGGEVIELRNLAEIVRLTINPNTVIRSTPIKTGMPENVYLSKSERYEELVRKYLNREPKSLIEQIEEIIKGLAGS